MADSQLAKSSMDRGFPRIMKVLADGPWEDDLPARSAAVRAASSLALFELAFHAEPCRGVRGLELARRTDLSREGA